jgi:hypothetical protein
VRSKRIGLTWLRRILLAVPFATATVLTFLISFADRFHLRSQRIAGYGFLFGTPWAWLLERNWRQISIARIIDASGGVLSAMG